MGKGVKALVIILVIAVLGLSTYIVLDKTVLNKDTKKESQNVTTDNTTTNNTEESNLVGLYTCKNPLTEDIGINYELFLYQDGTYRYIRCLYAPVGALGTYTIDGNKLVLNVQYETGSDMSLGVYNNPIQILLDINTDGTISDRIGMYSEFGKEHNVNFDFNNVVMTKATAAEETEYLNMYPSIQSVISKYREDDKYVADDNSTGTNTTNTTSTTNTNNSDKVGAYRFEKITSEENISVYYTLCLYKDGSYSYTKSIGFPRGTIGTYSVSGDTIILTAKYHTGSDVSLGVYKNPKTIILNINSDGSISDKNATDNQDELGVFATNGDVDYTNIIMTKRPNSEIAEYTAESAIDRIEQVPGQYQYIISGDETEDDIWSAFLYKLSQASENNEKLLDWRVDEVKILSDSEKQTYMSHGYKSTDVLVLVTYSVKPENINNSKWIAGNGTISGDWIIEKQACECYRDGKLIGEGFATSW